MHGLPKDIDLSFFVGKTLNVVSFAVNVIHLHFDDGVCVGLESTFQHQQKQDVENHLTGTIQSVYQIQASSLMQLAGHAVVAVNGTEEGTLVLTFDNGHILHCLEDDAPYECYNFTDGQQTWYV